MKKPIFKYFSTMIKLVTSKTSNFVKNGFFFKLFTNTNKNKIKLRVYDNILKNKTKINYKMGINADSILKYTFIVFFKNTISFSLHILDKFLVYFWIKQLTQNVFSFFNTAFKNKRKDQTLFIYFWKASLILIVFLTII